MGTEENFVVGSAVLGMSAGYLKYRSYCKKALFEMAKGPSLFKSAEKEFVNNFLKNSNAIPKSLGIGLAVTAGALGISMLAQHLFDKQA